MTKITVLFFATIRDHMGARQIEVDLPSHSGVDDLVKLLISIKPDSSAVLENALVSINKEYAFGDETIPDGAEVAFFPHVSGG